MRKVSLSVRVANTWSEQIIGLLNSEQPQNLLLKTRFGIHTFGMKYPIDVIVLDEQSIVRDYKQNLKPNRIFVWNPLFKTVIELKQGTIQENNIKKGTLINLHE